MARVAVILSGCGVFDGTEVHEAVLTLLALDRAGAAQVVGVVGATTRRGEGEDGNRKERTCRKHWD